MPWRTPSESDLSATLSQREIEAFRRSAEFASDPVPALIMRAAELARGYLRRGGVAMDPVAGSVPEGLVSAVCDYAAFDILKRLPVEVNKDRADARRAAVALFEAVASRKYAPEPFGETDDSGGRPVPIISDPSSDAILG